MRSKRWDLIEVVAEGDATSGIGSEKKSSIHSLALRTVLAVGTDQAAQLRFARAMIVRVALLAAACLPRSSARAGAS